MKAIIITSIILSFITVSAWAEKSYEVSFTNLTKGQPMTPLVIFSHSAPYDLFTLAEKASEGLSQQAKDGLTKLLVEELKASKTVSNIVVSEGLTLPGNTITIIIQDIQNHAKLSFSSMLAKTNDAFVSIKNIKLKLKKGESHTLFAKVYDAGVEDNNESKDYIPALGSPNADTINNEGFVTFHPGISGRGDLKPLTDSFSLIAAKIVIKRIK